MAKQTKDSNAELQSALEAFGATSVAPKQLTATPIKWDDSSKGKQYILAFIGRKTVTNKDGKDFEVCLFSDVDGNIRVASLGVSTTSLETVQRGDILSITFNGTRKSMGNRNMNDFTIALIGHSDSV